VLATAIALLCAGIAVATNLAPAGAALNNPGAVTLTLHDGVMGTPFGDFTPMTGTLAGTADSEGTLNLPSASITFASFDVAVTNPVPTTVTVTPVADSDFVGTVDPASGLVTLAGQLTTKLTIPAFGLADCPLGPISVNVSTANTGGSAYQAGSAVLTDNNLVVPAIASGAAGCAGFETTINGLVGLPTAPGASTLTMPLTFSPELTGSGSSTTTSSSTTSSSTSSSSTTSTTTPTSPVPDRDDPCAPSTLPTTVAGKATAPSGPADATIDVDADHTPGQVNTKLTGAVWNSGASITPLADVHPAVVRIDGSLQSRSQGPDQLDLTPLLERVAQVRAIGAEPLVILSYMPRWLGAPRAGETKDPTRVAPYDLDLWEDLVTEVVRTLATAPQPAYRFEVWNEPDLSVFWQDTSEAFTAMALRSHEAVANVEAETHKPLQIGGPGSAFSPNPQMVQYLQSVADAHLPLDFVSWHKYANAPFLGPDGPEGNLPIDVYEALAKRNPNSTPLDYSKEILEVRATIGTALAGSGLNPYFTIDEWNVSAGGYDLRHDDAEGASLVAGALIEMERAGLDEAAIYRGISGEEDRPGDWGIVHADGSPKPSWWVFRAWSTMTGSRLVTGGDSPTTGLWARATRDGGCINVLLTNFVATGAPARTVRVDLNGDNPPCSGQTTASLATLDASSTSLESGRVVQLDEQLSAEISMAPQSVALLRINCVQDADQPTTTTTAASTTAPDDTSIAASEAAAATTRPRFTG
jgi:hypothetical protein